MNYFYWVGIGNDYVTVGQGDWRDTRRDDVENALQELFL